MAQRFKELDATAASGLSRLERLADAVVWTTLAIVFLGSAGALIGGAIV